MGVRIFDDNYLIPSLISNQYKSSEQAAFPLTNAFNFQRRSRVWRSNGYWNITSSNNTIIFRETTGVDLTATVAVSEYTSTTALYAAIKTALEAVGASTYTISQDATTLKHKFTSNGSGGGGIFEIYWSNASTTMETILGFSSDEDDTGALTYTADALRIHTSEWITWDFGITTLPKAFALIGARNDPIKITPSATITLSANETNVWTSPTYQTTITYDDEVMYVTSSTGLWTEALRYARLDIVDNDNTAGYIEVGALYLGDFFDPTRARVQYPFAGSYVDRSITTFSEGGQSFSDVREKTEVFSISWFGLTVAEKEQIDTMWLSFGTSQPFFVEFDPDTSFYSTVNKSIRYVKFQQEPSYDLVSPANFSCRMTLREEL